MSQKLWNAVFLLISVLVIIGGGYRCATRVNTGAFTPSAPVFEPDPYDLYGDAESSPPSKTSEEAGDITEQASREGSCPRSAYREMTDRFGGGVCLYPVEFGQYGGLPSRPKCEL